MRLPFPPHRGLLATVVAAALTASPTVGAADEAPGTAMTQTFAADWFAEASPHDAADMLRRLPGFTVAEGDEDVRGYSGALGNVLVDGARPASKRDDIEDLLARIPASTVERIELIRGGAGVDMAGHTVLANIVRRADPAPELALEGGVAASGDGQAWPVATFEYGRRRAGTTLDLGYERDASHGDDAGRGRIVRRDAAGVTTARARTEGRAEETEEVASLGWRQPWLRGTFAVDAALRRDRFAFDGAVVALDEGFDDERTREDETLRQEELALRYEREHDGRRLSAIASVQRGRLDAGEFATEGGDVERFDETTRTRESLASVIVGRELGDRLVLGAGIEFAANRLQGRARLVENGEAVALPGSRVDVGEDRGEASAGLQWQASDALRVDAGLRVEHSRLGQRGDVPASRRLTYVKPRASLDWQATPRQRWRLSVAREVGQLDFGDFVASASLADDQVSAGATTLVPEQAWRSELAWEARFGDDGSLVLTGFHEAVQDVVDRVPVFDADGTVFDAPGNLGDGRRTGLVVALGVSLDPVGLRGARLTADLLWQRTRVRDPDTGAWRGISGDASREGTLGVEQVVGDGGFTWGVEVDLAERETEYRHDERTVETEGVSWTLFGERRFGDGWRLRAALSDAGGQSIDRVRDRWDGTRGEGTYVGRETRSHRTPGLLLLTLRREFGG